MIFRATYWKPENNVEVKIKAGFINSNDNVDDDCYSSFNNHKHDLNMIHFIYFN